MSDQKQASASRWLSIFAIATSLSACAQPKALYSWESYQPSVYAYLKDEDTDYLSQTETLEKNVEVARGRNEALPPGFRAHLGMLYLKNGQSDKAFKQFEDEKTVYPESTGFMDFLMRNQGRPTASIGQPSPNTISSPTTPANQSAKGS